jgi:rhodanese-related sulfurtransferase
VADLQHRLDSGERVTLIDVRSPTLFTRGHLPGAINIPASVCAQHNLPPLGKVVVYGAGLGPDAVEEAAKALGAKPGITVEILDGGYSSWESMHGMTTTGRGVKPEAFNYMTYAELKRAKLEEVQLVDLRKAQSPKAQLAAGGPATPAAPLTDLSVEFPGAHISRGIPEKVAIAASGVPNLVVLVDNGDGTAYATARKLKASGVKRYAILVGGELALARKGQPGLQRMGAHPPQTTPSVTPAAK